MQQTRSAERDPWFDNIKGLLMILVVVNHLNAPLVKYSGVIEITYKMINSFHMPCFMFLTGFMSKSRINSRNYQKMFTRLVIPYFVSQFLVWAFACIFPNGLSQISFQSTDRLLWLVPNYHLWYLFAVIVFNFVTPGLVSAFRKYPWLLLGLSFVCSVLIGYGPEILYMRLNKIIAYYPLFLTGYFFRKEWLAELRNKTGWKICGVVILAVWTAVFVLYHKHFYKNVFPMATAYSLYPEQFSGYYPVVARCILLAGSLLVSFAFMSIVVKKRVFFTYIGENSLYVYILHGFFVIAIRTYNDYMHPVFKRINTRGEKLVYILFGIALTFFLASPMVVKMFKWILEPEIDLKLGKMNTGGSKHESK